MTEEEARSIAKGEVGRLALFVILLIWAFAWFTSKHHDRIKKLEAAIEIINQPKENK